MRLSALGCFFVLEQIVLYHGEFWHGENRFAEKMVGNEAQNQIVYNFITSCCVSLILFSVIMALKNDTRL